MASDAIAFFNRIAGTPSGPGAEFGLKGKIKGGENLKDFRGPFGGEHGRI